MENVEIIQGISRLTSLIPSFESVYSSAFYKIIKEQVLNPADRHRVLNTLSELLLIPSNTLIIASLFAPSLLELLNYCIDFESGLQNIEKHEAICVTFSKLIHLFPSVREICNRYFEKSQSLLARFENFDNEPLLKKFKGNGFSDHQIQLEDLLEAVIQLLFYNKKFFKRKCNWSPLILLLKHDKTESKVRWLSCQCLALIYNISCSELVRRFLTCEEDVKITIKYNFLYNYIAKKENILFSSLNLYDELQPSSARKSYFDSECCPNVVSVSGILLHKIGVENEKQDQQNFILVPSVQGLLKDLAFAITSGDSVLLQGPIGCGKTAFVEYLASVTGRSGLPHFVKVHLSEQIDSKILIGSYCCTDIPGEFVWKPGPLTHAMIGGHWILLEDLDHAPMDIVSLLLSVLQYKSIFLPGHSEPLEAATGFQLFATRRLIAGVGEVHLESHSHADILNKFWKIVTVDSLSITELKQIILTRWPSLDAVTDELLNVFSMMSSGGHNSQEENITLKYIFSSSKRLISTRDLIKWCQRIAKILKTNEKLDLKSGKNSVSIFQDALDCFCQSIPKLNERMPIAEAIASKLYISKAKAQQYSQHHKPVLDISSNIVEIGRTFLCRNVSQITPAKKSFVFAETRQALAVLERISVAIRNEEPVLLVGETGTGKTSVIQYLSYITGHKLIVINMNQQSDYIDLLGGYKPVEIKYAVSALREEYEDVFCQTFSRDKNQNFLNNLATCYHGNHIIKMLKVMKGPMNSESARKYLTCNSELYEKWQMLMEKIKKLETQVSQIKNALVFSFIEGSLIKAMKQGHWILLDEINLAEAETLECLGGLLENSSGSLLLLEKGDEKVIDRHKDFQLFACMNPSTDVGKRDLPSGIRNRFTEFFIEELEEKSDLHTLISSYLEGLSLPSSIVKHILHFYLDMKKMAVECLSDGTGHHPHYSLRTLCRALSYAATNPFNNSSRSLYEAFCLSFLSQLDSPSYQIVKTEIQKLVKKQNQEINLSKELIQPTEGKYQNVCGYWIRQGISLPSVPENYILTDTVSQNLSDLARIVAVGKHPVLLQGDTSVGKTSLVQYLAEITGNRCLRINNHEHTDLQEYIGTYCADHTGKLVFKEGILVEAMKQGYWIILDELNLAPTEVMEALNRVLDDNRELFICETQKVIKAHPQFMLFATQNPPGLYGGRKLLSRAFRNRFIELHFTEIPTSELETILHNRCAIPLSYCKKMVAIMKELQLVRRESGIFAGKQGYITLRDLFRWGERYRLAPEPSSKFYDWEQHIAEEGFMLLAGKVRRSEEEKVIQEVIQKHMKRSINMFELFTPGENHSLTTVHCLNYVNLSLPEQFKHLTWTFNLRRLAVLVGQALKFNEPILLVGDTGCGKTTICQLFANISNRNLYTVNCHMHSESSDFLGGLRPVRNHSNEDESKLFEWIDGPLVQALSTGSFFLADEISLADDSVLERLNSVLEPERTILLSEKGGTENFDEIVVTASAGFHFLATMNPGGDFGKKELSPALRNRLTEIWCPSTTSIQDIIEIINHNIKINIPFEDIDSNWIATGIIEFLQWFTSYDICKKCSVSIRDVLSWVEFITCSASNLDIRYSYIHGAYLVYLDGLGSGVTAVENIRHIQQIKDKSLEFLINKVEQFTGKSVNLEEGGLLYSDSEFSSQKVEVVTNDLSFGIKPFFIPCGPFHDKGLKGNYTLEVHTPKLNALRLLRAMQLPKPILLEGTPGVGKTSLVTTLAKASGHEVIRINLSEQTDIGDLFGTDLPVEGGQSGEFAWRDGPFMQAFKKGDWILLDEMNLASQSVLEGLNACLDHRGEVYIPELDKTFVLEKNTTRIFGCQNSYKQGNARKGLPRSFLNRFTQIYIEPLSSLDLEFIAQSIFPSIPVDIIKQMIKFNEKISSEVQINKCWGQKGAPWEFNLREIFRWCEVMLEDQDETSYNPYDYVGLIYADRMRTLFDKQKVYDAYLEMFGSSPKHQLHLNVTDTYMQVGYSFLDCSSQRYNSNRPYYFLHHQLSPLQSLMKCISMNWLCILVGPSGVGKTTIVHILAELTGQPLDVLPVNSEMDTVELLGGFEQLDLLRHIDLVRKDLELILDHLMQKFLLSLHSEEVFPVILNIISVWSRQKFKTVYSTTKDDVQFAQTQIEFLENIILIMKKCYSSCNTKSYETVIEEVSNVEYRLKTLKLNLDSIKTSGGRFEWVDSILVNALQKGHWLLIDDVNFCSPSVLDRLNGLLEPNGVLTVTEQGSIDGHARTIIPHPKFRLIFTMDPKNGEISHAMRNRGVEVFISGDDDGGNTDQWDRCTLLQNAGVSYPWLINCLLKIYDSLAEKNLNISKTANLELLQSATLCSQQLHMGIEPGSALWKSCHITSVRNILSHSNREIAAKLVCDAINEMVPDEHNETRSMWFCVRPSTTDYQLNSSFARVKQQSLLLVYLLDNFITFKEGKVNLDILPSPFSSVLVPKNIKQWTKAFSCAIRIFFENSTCNDWNCRKFWIFQLLRNKHFSEKQELYKSFVNSIENYVHSLSKDYADIIEELQVTIEELLKFECASDFLPCDQIPLDLRWNSCLLKKLNSIAQKSNISQDAFHVKFIITSLGNKLHLLLLFEQLMFLEERELKGKKLQHFQQNDLSIIELSNNFNDGFINIKEGPITIQDLGYPVLQHIIQFFNSFISDFILLLKKDSFYCSNDFFWQFKEARYLLHNFWKFCCESFTIHSLNSQISIFAVYWIWIKKNIFILFEDGSTEEPSFSSTTKMIISCITEDLSEWLTHEHIYRSQLVSILGFPNPLTTQDSADTFINAALLSQMIHIPSDINSTYIPKITAVIKSGELWLSELSNAMQEAKSVNKLEAAKKRISLIKGQLQQSSMFQRLENKENSSNSVDYNKLTVFIQLLPLWDYFFVQVESELLLSTCHKLQSELCIQKLIEFKASSSDELANKFKFALKIGSSKIFLNCLHFTTLIEINENTIKSSLTKFFMYFFHHLRNGPSSGNLHSFLAWQAGSATKEDFYNEDDDVIEIIDDVPIWKCQEVWANQSPVLTLISTTILSGNQSFEAIDSSLPLGMLSDKVEELSLFSNLLWKNSHMFSFQSSLFRKNIATAITLWFNSLLQALITSEDIDIKLSDINLTTLNSTELNLSSTIKDLIINSLANIDTLKKYLTAGDLEWNDGQNAHFFWLIGKVITYVGLLTVILLAPLDVIDPVRKNEIKLNNEISYIKDASLNINFYKWLKLSTLGHSWLTTDLEDIHPLVNESVRNHQKKTKLIERLEKCIAYRSSSVLYDSLLTEIKYHFKVAHPNDVCSLINCLEEKKNVYNEGNFQKLKKLRDLYSKFSSKYKGHPDFLTYQDLLVPFLTGIEQVAFGLKMMQHYLCSLQVKLKYSTENFMAIESLIILLASFPYSSPNLSNLAKTLISPRNISHIHSLCSHQKSHVHTVIKVLRCALLELKNEVIICPLKSKKTEIMTVMNTILMQFVNLWNKQEERLKLKKSEEEELYKIKKSKDLTEEQKEELELKTMFPLFTEDMEDLNVYKESENENNNFKVPELGVQNKEPITDDIMKDVWYTHELLVQVLSQFYTSFPEANVKQIDNVIDFKSSFLLRYELMKDIIHTNGEYLDSSLDKHLIGSHIFVSSLIQQTTAKTQIKEAFYDVYHDSNAAEVVLCFPVLEKFSNAICCFQKEFPDNPTLKNILAVIHRILSFPVTSPVMRFSAGLEILHHVANEWQVNAHKGVSVETELGEITNLILRYRKLELNCWSQCLNVTELKCYNSCAKLWFQLYSLFIPFIESCGDESQIWDCETESKFVISMQQFIEDASLGDFKARINLLLIFLLHVLSYKNSYTTTKIFNIVFNVYNFYKQFLPSVQNKIESERKPIECKVKDEIKIAQYHSKPNFWVVKQTVQKSHQVIFKAVNQYLKQLNLEAKHFYHVEYSGKHASVEKSIIIDEKSFILPESVALIDVNNEQSIWNEIARLEKKVHLFCKRIINNSPLLIKASILNDLTKEVIVTVQDLQSLDISKEADKDKRKREIRAIQQRKQNALNELFNILSDLGLSYRKGNQYFRKITSTQYMTVPALYMNEHSNIIISDNCINELVEDCNSYYFKSVAYSSIFVASLRSPPKIKQQDVERCQGFAYHLMHLIIKQRVNLPDNSKHYIQLMNKISELENIPKQNVHPNEESELVMLPHQLKLQKCKEKLTNLVLQSSVCLQQFKMLLESVPSHIDGQPISIYPTENLPVLIGAVKGDELWESAVKKIEHMLSIVQSVGTILNNFSEGLLMWNHFYDLKNCFDKFHDISRDLKNICTCLNFVGESNCFSESLQNIVQQINQDFEFFNQESSQMLQQSKFENLSGSSELCSENDAAYLDKFFNLTDLLTRKTCKVIEHFYKMIKDGVSGDSKTDNEDNCSIEKNHLTKELYEKLKTIFNQIEIYSVQNLLEEVLEEASNLWDSGIKPHAFQSCMKFIMSTLPVLQEYANLYKYYLTVELYCHRTMCKLEFIMLKIFSDLLLKGFCLPEDAEENAENSTEFHNIEEGGLSEGIGSKDVSEKIDNEDQLEDLKKDDDYDCEQKQEMKDEENAVEMSESFEGKLHDADEEVSNNSDEDENEDVDNMMGDIQQEVADKLDDKLWGSDEEEELKADESGKGKSEKAEPDMVAKDSKTEGEQIDQERAESKNEEEYCEEHPVPELPTEEAPANIDIPDKLDLDKEECPDKEDDQEDMNDFDIDAAKDDENGDAKNDDEVEKCDEKEKDEELDRIETENITEEDENKDEIKPEDKDENKRENGLENSSEDKTFSKDETLCAADQNKYSNSSNFEDMEWESNGKENQQGIGQAENELYTEDGFRGTGANIQSQGKEDISEHQQNQKFRQPKDQRTLGSGQDSATEKLTVTDMEKDTVEMPEISQHANLYQHIKNNPENFDAETTDIASEKQAMEQPLSPRRNNNHEEVDTDDDVILLEEVNNVDMKEAPMLRGSKFKEEKDSDDNAGEIPNNDNMNIDDMLGEKIQTHNVQRGFESSIHTQHDLWSTLCTPDIERLQNDLTHKLDLIDTVQIENKSVAEELWNQCEKVVSPLIQELCEQLRLVLEPTKASKLKGDYRTGKRLNMRKVIAYVASQFRKDKIWLRRTKPSKREYNILLAVDDSCSMKDNKTRQLAFESLALLCKSLSLLETGQISVINFGEKVNILHAFEQPFTEQTGSNILSSFSFNQQKTQIAQMLNFAVNAMVHSQMAPTSRSKETMQLLIIISDGRGLFNEGEETVRRAVKEARHKSIFLLFLVLDNPENKDSILDIRVPVFNKPGQTCEFVSYMEQFPFPFYIVLRNITSLPLILGEALRQWFELVTSTEH